jgi:hypothetical protein
MLPQLAADGIINAAAIAVNPTKNRMRKFLIARVL